MKRNRIVLLALLCLFSAQIVKSQSNVSYDATAGNSGSNNSSFGYYAGDVVTGNYNTFSGHYAGKGNSSGSYNVFSGSLTGYANTSGNYNTYLGYSVCTVATTANHNTSVGYQSGKKISSGSNNTFLGSKAGYNTSTGVRNVYMGCFTGYNSIGTYNVFMGYAAGYLETGSDKLFIENTSSSTPLIYGEFNNDLVVIYGKLGIGTSEFGDAKLAVNGTVVAKDIIVTVDDFPDYVFEDSYNLLPLPELQAFIETFKHLPGLRTEAEVLTEGLALGELNVQILEKVEELTLHMIDLDKKANGITQKGKELKKEIEILLTN